MRSSIPSPSRAALASLSLSMLLSSLGTSIANVGLPTLAQAFQAPFQAVQWVVLAYLLAITALVVGVGRLGDLLGRRRLLLAGLALFTAASLLCGAAPTLGWLVAARALQGLGAATMMALSLALVAETVPKDQTGSAMGLMGTVSAVGTALGPSLGGMLIVASGWQALFLVQVPLGLLAWVLAWRALPADPPRQAAPGTGFDPLGTLLLAAALGAYAWAMTARPGPAAGWGSGPAAGLLAAAVFGVLFVATESRVASPLLRLDLFRNKGLRTSLGINILVATVMMATLVVGPFYLSRGLGLAPAMVGLVLSLGPILSALCGVLAGRLVDRFGAPAMVGAGLAAMAVASLGLALLPPVFGLAGYIAAIALLTPGYQLFQAANNTAVMVDIPGNQRGLISGMLSLSRNLGLVTGASAMGAVFAWASAAPDVSTASAPAVTTGLQATFAVAAALLVGALAMAGSQGLRRARLYRQPH